MKENPWIESEISHQELDFFEEVKKKFASLPFPASSVLIRLNASARVALRHVISSFWSCTLFSKSETRSRNVSFSFSTMSSREWEANGGTY